MIQKRKIQIAGILFVVLLIIAVVEIWISKGYQSDRKTIQTNASKLVEFADSLRNSKPDTALYCYNQVIQELRKSKPEENNSHVLALAFVGLSNVYSDKGEYKLALKNDSMALELATATNDKPIKAKAFVIKGLTQFRLGEYENAMECYQTAMDLAKETNDFEIQAKIISNRAMIYFNQGDNQQTIDGFRKALEIGKQIKNELLIAGNYLNLAVVYTNLSKNDSVLIYNKLALDIFIKINDKNGELLCYKNLGVLYYGISDYGNALPNFQRSLDLAIEMSDKPNMAKGYHNLAEIYAHLGDNAMSTELLDKSISIKEKLGDKLSLAKGYIAVGDMFYARDDYSPAQAYYQKALKLFQELGNRNEIGHACGNMASVFSSQHKSDSAIIYYNKALELYKQVDYVYGLSNIYVNLGDEYRLQQKYSLAEKLFIKALNSKKELNDEENLAMVQNHLANLYLDQSKNLSGSQKATKLQQAEAAGLQSYNTGKRLKTIPVMKEASHSLEKVYECLGKFQEALKYSKEYKILSDSILNQSKIEALTFAEARWNIEKKQQEINNLEKTKKLNQEIILQQKTESRQQKLIIWFTTILFFLTLLSVSIIALYIRKRREAVHQKQLDSIAILRLQNTRNTISPHFVFNVLNNIWAIIDDRENARSQFSNLTNLIRRSLIHTDHIAISLEEEIEFVKSFTELQKFRLDNELDVRWNIAPDVNSKSHVPGMILQIPVENAIKHALAPKPENRELQINICSDLDFLILMVADNGDGYYNFSSPFKGTGTGLKVLTKTMNILNEKNEKKMSYEVINGNENGGKGTKVIIKIPLQYNYNLPGMTI